MNNITLLLLLVTIIIFLQDICCNENLLSRFHQHTFKLKDVRMELVSYDKEYIKFFEIKPFKYNRTTTAHNVTFTPNADTGDKVELLIESYKFLSNEYRPTAVKFQINAQKAFSSNAMGLRRISECGNMTSMHFYKDTTYHLCNFVVDESEFPPLIPNGKYKLEIAILFLNKETAAIYIYHEVYTPTKYPKN